MLDVRETLSAISDFLVRYDDFVFLKSLGEGGYGEVFLAEHVPTQTRCAVKRIRKDSAQEKNLLYLCREVMILANTRNYFLLPFLGYTDTPPYLIVTEYVPRGSLYDALMHMPESPVLTGTHKTRIAMGIACGMASLHSQSVMHRDLKSMNVLLDDRLLPRICDFGVARFTGDAEGLVTHKIGTPHWMAPELFTSQHYDNKVDVYAFAMILWEMLAEQIPFAGMSGPQVMIDVCERHLRPIIPEGTPDELRKLIEICWQEDPQKRPTFRQIYDVFAKGKVMFAGTDPAEVAQLAEHIRAIDPQTSLATDGVLEIEMPLTSKGIRPRETDPSLLVLRNPRSEQFLETFVKVIGDLTLEKAMSVFDAAKECLKVDLTRDALERVLSEFLSLLERNPGMVTMFVESGLFELLPFGSENHNTLVYKILLRVVSVMPSALTIDIAKRIIERAETDTRPLVSIFSALAMKSDKEPGILPIISIFLSRASVFVSSDSGAKFLRVVHHLKVHVPTFSDNGTLFMGLTSIKIHTVRAAYAALAPTWQRSADIPWDLVIGHLSLPELACDITGILMKLQDVPTLPSLLPALISAGAYSPHVPYIICRLCEAAQHRTYLVQNFSWMTGPMEPSAAFLVLLRLFIHPNLRQTITEARPLPDLLSAVAAGAKPDELMAISTMIRRMTLTQELVTRFADSQLLDRYILNTMCSNNRDLLNSCLVMIDAMARTGFVDKFLLLIPYIPRLIQSDVGVTALSTSLVLSYHPQTICAFQGVNMADIASRVVVPPDYERYKTELLKNLIGSPT